MRVTIEGTCSTCNHLVPAVPARPARVEQRDGAIRHLMAVAASPAYCGHHNDNVMSIEADDGAPGDPCYLICIHQPERFGCTRWNP